MENCKGTNCSKIENAHSHECIKQHEDAYRGKEVKIIQFMAMQNDECWQGHILGLGDDGVVYIDSHPTNGVAGWDVYVPARINK